MHEHRDVGTQPQAEGCQPLAAEVQPPQLVQGHQHGRGIRRTAAETAPHRNSLSDVDALPTLGLILQEFRSTNEEIVGF